MSAANGKGKAVTVAEEQGVTEAQAKKLEEISREERVLAWEILKFTNQKERVLHLKRAEVTRTIPQFWTTVLQNHPVIAHLLQYKGDQEAMEYLTDIWVEHEQNDCREYRIEFTFDENPFFSDSKLVKEYKYRRPGEDGSSSAKQEDGGVPLDILEGHEYDLETIPTLISWKSDEQNLPKKYPSALNANEDDQPAEPGSFFAWFENDDDPYDLGSLIANQMFPNAINYFQGEGDDEEVTDSEDEDEEDDDDPNKEIDLDDDEDRPKKRTRQA